MENISDRNLRDLLSMVEDAEDRAIEEAKTNEDVRDLLSTFNITAKEVGMWFVACQMWFVACQSAEKESLSTSITSLDWALEHLKVFLNLRAIERVVADYETENGISFSH